MAVKATPQDHPNRANDLNRAIDVADMVVKAMSQDHPDRADIRNMAVKATPQDHPNRSTYLNNLGNLLGRRFERTGSMDDLNRAIDVADMAVKATPQDHPNRANDLNRAIDIGNMAVKATPQDHPNRSTYLNNLGNLLGRRFKRTGSIDDLNRAIDVADMAVKATPQDHPNRASWLNNLGNWLGSRFERTGSMDDLNRAIDVADMAVKATPQDHPNRAGILSNLGAYLGSRFQRTGSMDDLNRAIDVADMAVKATPQDHPNRAAMLNNLGNWLGSRFERTGSMDDLNRAIDAADMAVKATPQDHPDRAGQLSNLGIWLGKRFERTGSMDDLNLALSSYEVGWACHSAPPSIRIKLARQAAAILAGQSNWEESSNFLQDATHLIPAVSPRSLKHTDKQHMLADFAGLSSAAAATALNAGKEPYHALQLLELGRGVIAGLLMELRGDISDLKQQHPDLARDFISLRDELDSPVDRTTIASPTDTAPSWESQSKRQYKADQEFNEILTRIRAKPAFRNFLLPPTADELMAAADPDPIVVVNLTAYRCDAFLVERAQIRVLELPGLTMKEVQERARDLRFSRNTLRMSTVLEWLWDAICGPSLEALGFKTSPSDGNWPRVWWVPTGVLSQLPLHAAGYHMRGSTATVLDRAMSSYASSVKALQYGRRHVLNHAGSMSDHALLVAMRETPGLNTNGTLPFAAAEVEMLHGLCPSLKLKPITPTLRHGQSHPTEPSQSCLLLEDWETNPLTVRDLRDHRLQENPPFLGYLSACSTGANEADKLADEGIHLVGAFQLAGFRHVVGTLWEVSDRHCVDVARVLYETMRDEGMTDLAVCRGLHRAVRALRGGQIEKEQGARKAFLLDPEALERGLLNSYWIPYVHFGV
ncbi:TPR domain-containing protein [Fusarium keratoplasticum]|nr:TPR domain-containing protein [Fusarium keratoplasticum]